MTKATIKDVAKLAGVSLKTVSRVINKEPSVRPAKIKLVQQAIDQLSYQPNLAARNLRSSKSYALGLVYNNPNPYYVIDLQAGALKVCKELGYGLQIHPCEAENDTIAQELIALVKNSDLSGLVLAPPISEQANIIKILRDNNIQYVGIVSDGQGDALEPCIKVDDRKAAQDITNHLIENDHSKIAFLWGETIHHSSAERYNGFCDALKDHGIPIDDTLVLEGAYSFESGFENAHKLMALTELPTAIFCSNDEIAAGALAALSANGIKVPNDIAITGFEDSPFSRHSTPAITTAKQSTVEISAAAAMHLVSQLRPQTQDGELITTFSPELVIRASSDKHT